MLIGYARVSKADGSQSLDLQHDALRAAGVEPGNLYDDRASGSRDDRSEEHTSELQSLMRNTYAVFCLKQKKHVDRLHDTITLVVHQPTTHSLDTQANAQK